MIQIGRRKILGKGTEQERVVEAIDKRITQLAYGHNSKYTRKLVVQLEAGDLVSIWPVRTKAKFTASVWDIYQWMCRGHAQKAQLEKARARKAKLATRRERRHLDYLEKKVNNPL